MLEALQTWWRRLTTRHIFMRERLVVYEGLASMLKSASTTAGKTLTFAAQFELWARRARTRGQRIAVAHAEIQRRLSAGLGLAKSMQPFIPIEEVMILDAGEASGRLLVTLESLVKNAQAGAQMSRAVREHYAAPVVTTVAFLGLTIFSGLTVWPTLLGALPATYWDGWALLMLHGQIFVANHLWLLLLIGLVYAYYRWSLPNWTGRIRQMAEQVLPPYAVYRDRQAAALLMVLAGLLRAGLTMDQALERVTRQGSRYLRWHTRTMQRRLIQHAADPTRVLATGIFGNEILDRIGNAAALRQLAEAVQHIGSDALDQVVGSVKTSAAVGGVILLSFASLLIAYYAAVQVIGAQVALDRFLKEVKSGSQMR